MLLTDRGGYSLNPIAEGEENERVPIKRSKNDLKELRSLRQLERIELDLDSPRWRLACHNLGISPRECAKK